MLPEHLYTSFFPTGSNYICNPPVTDTDIDFMYLVYSLEECADWLEENEWLRSGDASYAIKGWVSYRKDKYNLLLTEDQDHYTKFEAATELAKKRNLVKKEDRIALFNLIVGPMVYNKLNTVFLINNQPNNLNLAINNTLQTYTYAKAI